MPEAKKPTKKEKKAELAALLRKGMSGPIYKKALALLAEI
jgi:hypothetical protein